MVSCSVNNKGIKTKRSVCIHPLRKRRRYGDKRALYVSWFLATSLCQRSATRFGTARIRLYQLHTVRTLYLWSDDHYLKEFCDDRGYTFEVDRSVDADEDFSVEEAREFIKTLQMKLDPRDYQVDAFVHAIRKRRAMMLSPTASGKSLIIYLVTRFLDGKTLIIVPTTSLVSQLEKDFYEYGYDSQKYVHPIMSGADKNTDKPVVISTWQSIYKQKKDWFDQFDVVIGDEAHQFKAKSLTTIMTNLDGCSYRYGFTGTLDGTQTHKLVLEGAVRSSRKSYNNKNANGPR